MLARRCRRCLCVEPIYLISKFSIIQAEAKFGAYQGEEDNAKRGGKLGSIYAFEDIHFDFRPRDGMGFPFADQICYRLVRIVEVGICKHILQENNGI